MGMGGPMHMNMWQRRMTTNQAILTLTQWLSPAYPVGAFAYSHGLEAAIQHGHITTGDALQEWLHDILYHGSGRNDCILLRCAHAAKDAPELTKINDTGLAIAACAERRLEAAAQGLAFGKTTAAIWGGKDRACIYPVAVGAAAARLKIDADLTAAIYLQAMISNLIAAAQRLMALGQTEGQGILTSLTPLCADVAAQTQDSTLDDLHSSAFLSDIAAMHHETQQPRIFRS